MKQMRLRLRALANTFKHANAYFTENKREVRAMELKDSIIFDELYSGISPQALENIKLYKIFDNGDTCHCITRNDERGNAELPDIFSRSDIERIKREYNLLPKEELEEQSVSKTLTK